MRVVDQSKAQTVLEYIILIGVVTTVLLAMSTMFKRGVQGIVKITADQFGNQLNSEQIASPKTGFLVNSYSLSTSDTHKQRLEDLGTFNYVYDDTTQSMSNSFVNLGFTERAN